MNKSKYLIGDVANLMGISRDTLRHYEKRGLLTARKAANGYRYYTEADISRFISILYQRNISFCMTLPHCGMSTAPWIPRNTCATSSGSA